MSHFSGMRILWALGLQSYLDWMADEVEFDLLILGSGIDAGENKHCLKM